LTESKSRKTTSTRKSQLNGSSEIKRKRSHLDKKTSSPKIKTNLSDDNLINEMLADTARSTLQEQIAADRNKNASAVAGGDYAAKKVASSELNDLFGDAAGKWSQLAFFDKN
jgi:DNA/RNA endonuclease YhcR with UshA esterase domain